MQSVTSAFFHLGNRAEISHINQGEIGPRQPGSCEEAVKWPTRRFISGSLSNDDSDGNKNGKKATGSDWQNKNFARASLFFVHFFAVVARLRRESAFFHVLSRMAEHKTTTFFFFSWTLIQSFRIQLEKNLSTLIWRIKRDGISAIKFEAVRIHFFKWRFRSRPRRCCLSSLIFFSPCPPSLSPHPFVLGL